MKVHRIAHVITDGYYGYIWIEQYICRIIVNFCEGRYRILWLKRDIKVIKYFLWINGDL